VTPIFRLGYDPLTLPGPLLTARDGPSRRISEMISRAASDKVSKEWGIFESIPHFNPRKPFNQNEHFTRLLAPSGRVKHKMSNT
jgi:hypothetical protein